MATGYAVPIIIDATGSKEGAEQVKKHLQGVIDKAEKANKPISRLEKQMKQLGTAMTAVAAAGMVALSAALVKFSKDVIAIGSEFEQLRAQLKTVEGSAAGAEAAFARISEFAKKTPYEVSNITKAWVELRGIGLKPTMDQFNALGNLAAARGKDILDAAQATTAAIFGETERLKAFGIQAKVAGDEITLTYDGMSQTVKRNADEVISAITKISNSNFGGAMADQANTVAGAWSNVKDAYAQFADEVFQSGVGEFLTQWLRSVAEAISDWKVYLTAGQIAWAKLEMGVTEAVHQILSQIMDLLDMMVKWEDFTNKFRIIPDHTVRDFRDSIGDVTAGYEELIAEQEANIATMERGIGAIESTVDALEDLGNTAANVREWSDALVKKIQAEIDLEFEAEFRAHVLATIESVEIGSSAELERQMGSILSEALRAVESTMPEIEIDPEAYTAEYEAIRQAASLAAEEQRTYVKALAEGAIEIGEAAGMSEDLADGIELALMAMDAYRMSQEAVAAQTQLSELQNSKLSASLKVAQAEAAATGTAMNAALGWIGLIIAAIVKIFQHMKAKSKKAKRRSEKELEAQKLLYKWTNQYVGAQVELQQQYEKAMKGLRNANEERELTIGYEKELAKVRLEQTEEYLNQEYDILDTLSKYIDDQRISERMAELKMEMEIANLKIQLIMLEQTGLVAKETLDWITAMVNEVEQGLRDGTLTFTEGYDQPSAPSPPRRHSGGQNPLEQWADLLDTARQLAGVEANRLNEIVSHFEEMREHSRRMRGNEEERAARAAQIAELERMAYEEYGLTLLEKVYQATGNEEKLQELARIRFEMERIATMAQIDALLAMGVVSEETAAWLAQAREDLENFTWPEPPEPGQEASRSAFDSFMESYNRANDAASKLFDDWNTLLTTMYEDGWTAEDADLWAMAWEQAQAAAQDIAYSMMDSLARAVESEEDMKKLAILRHQMEVANYRAQAALLKSFLDPEDYQWLMSLIDDFANLDPTAGIGGGGSGSGSVVGAIYDQTDDLVNALADLADFMYSLLLGSQSPLSPEQRMAEAQRQYAELFAAAQAGDVDAIRQLQQFIPNFLSIAESFFGGTATTGYVDLFNSIISDLAMLTGADNPLLNPGGAGLVDIEPIVTTQIAHMNEAHNDAEDIKIEQRTTRGEVRRLADSFDAWAAASGGVAAA